MAIKNGQRKNIILFLRFFYSLVPSQPALQLEVLVSVIDQVQLCGTPSFWIMGRPQHRCHLLFQEFLLLFLLFGQFQHIFFIYS